MSRNKDIEEQRKQRELAYKTARRKSGRYNNTETGKSANNTDNILSYVNDVLMPNAAAQIQKNQKSMQPFSSTENKIQQTQQVQQSTNNAQASTATLNMPLPTVKLSGKATTQRSTVIGAMEAMTGKPAGYANRAAEGLRQWKNDRHKLQQQTNTPGYQRFVEHMTKNNAAGTVEGIAAIPELLGVDNSAYEPRNEWTVAQRNEFGYLYAQDPKVAKEYAKSVNDGYKQKNEEKTLQWIKQNEGPALYSLLVTDQLGLAETLNSELSFARDGQLPYTTQVTPSRYSELVHQVIEEDAYNKSSVDGRLANAFANAANEAYYSYLQKLGGGVFGAAAGATVDYSNGFNSALHDAKARGLSDAEALEYARGRGFAKGSGSLVSGVLSKRLPDGKDLKTSMARESISGLVGGIATNALNMNSGYEELVEKYIKQQVPRDKAEKLAEKQILRKFGSDALNDLFDGAIYGWGISDHEVARVLRRG